MLVRVRAVLISGSLLPKCSRIHPDSGKNGREGERERSYPTFFPAVEGRLWLVEYGSALARSRLPVSF